MTTIDRLELLAQLHNVAAVCCAIQFHVEQSGMPLTSAILAGAIDSDAMDMLDAIDWRKMVIMLDAAIELL